MVSSVLTMKFSFKSFKRLDPPRENAPVLGRKVREMFQPWLHKFLQTMKPRILCNIFRYFFSQPLGLILGEIKSNHLF